MIEVGALAMAAVGFLAPYVGEAGTELAKKVGGEVGQRLIKLYDTVKGKLTGAAGQEILADFEEQPEDEGHKAALASQLRKALEADSTFRDELAQLVAEIETRGGDTIRQVAKVIGDQNKVVQIAKDSGNIVNM